MAAVAVRGVCQEMWQALGGRCHQGSNTCLQVLKLAALRVRDICERLDFEPLDRETVCLQARSRHPCMATPGEARTPGQAAAAAP